MNKFCIWIYYNWKNLYYYRNSVVWFGRADGLQRLKTQSLYHEILLYKGFNFKTHKKINLQKKTWGCFTVLNVKKLHERMRIVCRPKRFWTVQMVLDAFGRVQIILVRFKLDFSGLIFIIWTCPKWFGPDQN
jgi:hypothetical protein